mmetsp:Transcript_34037/g.32469  ORF Transcript_34037/g.32469 Transcript_34037/m.32469 type:complete len:457 (+) Transcript_34037:129-1499(+)|eukprot:CAMPEP_0119038756 /NCGR_PEP_ID=MMETSP1177-20130426/7867_1 /TAXON_ID=2985 /ORGANISM="Ochromonas sp, Strain CCMP1899" /LENGTH=456 /DNA_ID=CAMNT_0007001753 /DNA_START=61 /DNA_END=1431 /DNA_ORIENTATION=+
MIFSDFTQQKLLGHTGRCFDIRYSNDSNLLLSASEDGHALLWDLKSKKVCGKFLHNRESEVLRATFLNIDSTLITTCGADGKAIIWKTNQHGRDEKDSSTNMDAKISKKSVLSHGTSQIYACESLDINNDNSLLMTAADSVLYLWDYSKSVSMPLHTWTATPSPLSEEDKADHVNYGGPRNPTNEIFIFDARINPCTNNIIALALSDGNVRQVDVRIPNFCSSNNLENNSTFSGNNMAAPVSKDLGTPVPASRNLDENTLNSKNDLISNLSTLSLCSLTTSPSKRARVSAHATSVCYSQDGLSLLAAMGSGDIAVLDLRMGLVRTLLKSHTRACFGASFVSQNMKRDSESSSSHCMSWSSDNSIRYWDISVDGLCTEPDDIIEIPGFPIYSCTMRKGERSDKRQTRKNERTDENERADEEEEFSEGQRRGGIEFACGGGNGDTSFVGTPIHLFQEP